MSSFSKKTIEVHLSTGIGSESGLELGVSKVIRGLPTTVTVTKTGGADLNGASVSIGGMKLGEMALLTKLSSKPLESWKNSLTILAGEEGGLLSQVFKGEITSANADFARAPDLYLNLTAKTGSYAIQEAEGPFAAVGSIRVSDVIRQMAEKMGYEFVNEGVTAQLLDPYLEGSLLEKARFAAEHAGAELLVDDGRLVLKKAGLPRLEMTVELSETSGLIGYPTFADQNISLSALFNPQFGLGGVVSVKSIVPEASGEWRITKLTHELSAYTEGSWLSRIEGERV